MRCRFKILLLTALPLMGCADFPDLDAAIAQRGIVPGFPELIPIDAVLLATEIDSLNAAEQTRILTARVSQLKVRAAALRRPVVDPKTSRKMAAVLQRHNG